MFFPIYDESLPQLKKPFVVIGLIVVNVVIFLLAWLTGLEHAVHSTGLVPEQIFDGQGWWRIVPSMFMHGGWIHLIFNMWFLWLFGDNVEDIVGHLRFLVLYLLGGVLAGLFHAVAVPFEGFSIPAVGASGAISAVMGAYVLLFKHNKIRTVSFFFIRPIFYSVKAWVFIGIWFIIQFMLLNQPDEIAYGAHVGGFLAGMGLLYVVRIGTKKRFHYGRGRWKAY